jgi:hypothetical protein
MLTMGDAETAFEMIKSCYGPHILPGLRNKQARDIYVFCDEMEFATWFQMTYVTAFKKANAVLIPDLIASSDINGFVNAQGDYDARRIYIPKRNGILWGTLAHEALHYFSHKAFYPEFYLVGGQHPFQVEGATEYLTRQADIRLASRRNYQSHYERTCAWLSGDKGNYVRMVNFLFQGIPVDLSSIHS